MLFSHCLLLSPPPASRFVRIVPAGIMLKADCSIWRPDPGKVVRDIPRGPTELRWSFRDARNQIKYLTEPAAWSWARKPPKLGLSYLEQQALARRTPHPNLVHDFVHSANDGYDILVYYLTLIFSQVGLSSFMSSLLAAISLTIQFGGSLLCIPTIERLGRRKNMLLTSSVQFCCMLLFVVLNSLPKKTDATEWTAAIIMLPYLFMYGWGWVACPW